MNGAFVLMMKLLRMLRMLMVKKIGFLTTAVCMGLVMNVMFPTLSATVIGGMTNISAHLVVLI